MSNYIIMKIILLIIFSLLIISCENVIRESASVEIKGSSKISLDDFEAPSSYPNIYVEKGTGFNQRNLEESYRALGNIYNFLEIYFPDFISKLGITSKKDIKIYFTDSEEVTEKLTQKYPKNVFIKSFFLQYLFYQKCSFQIIKRLLSVVHRNNETFSQNDLEDLSRVIYRLFEMSTYWSCENKKELSRTKLHEVYQLARTPPRVVGNIKVNDSILRAIFKLKIDKKESLGGIEGFSDNIFHLMNLIEIARINFLRFSEIEICTKSLTNVDEFIENLKLGKRVSAEKLKLTSEIFLNQNQKPQDYYLKTFFKIYLFKEKVFFVYPAIKDINFEWLTEYAEHELKFNPKRNKNFIIVNPEARSYLDSNLDHICMIRVPENISEIDQKEEFIQAINKITKSKFIEGLTVKDNVYKNAFIKYYNQIGRFSESNLQDMDFTDLVESYKLFIQVLFLPSSNLSSINTLDELIDFPKSDKGVGLIKAPKEDEIRFFLQNVERERLNLFLSSDSEILMKNFLHFRHLLTTVRIAKEYRSLDSQLYGYLKRELKEFLNNPLKEQRDAEYLAKMSLFFNPFDHFLEKIKNFWNYKYDISAYILDHYKLMKDGGSCLINNFSHSKLKGTIRSGGRTPLMYLRFGSHETVDFLIKVVLSHEIGHHLQGSGNFVNFFTTTYDQKVDRMGSELEADMYAGFYGHHSDGLNLTRNEIIEISNLTKKYYGDTNLNFRDSEDPHGRGYQRKYAYLLGANFSKLPKWKHINFDTKERLHEEFKDIYLNTSYLRNPELYPEIENLFSESFSPEEYQKLPPKIFKNKETVVYDFQESEYSNIFLSKHIKPYNFELKKQLEEVSLTLDSLLKFLKRSFPSSFFKNNSDIYLSVDDSDSKLEIKNINSKSIILRKSDFYLEKQVLLDKVISALFFSFKEEYYFYFGERYLKSHFVSLIRVLFEISNNNSVSDIDSFIIPEAHEIHQLSDGYNKLNSALVLDLYKEKVNKKESLGSFKYFILDIISLMNLTELTKLYYFNDKNQADKHLSFLNLFIAKLREQAFEEPIGGGIEDVFNLQSLVTKSVKDLRNTNWSALKRQAFDSLKHLGGKDQIQSKTTELWARYKLFLYNEKAIFIERNLVNIDLSRVIQNAERKWLKDKSLNKDYIVVKDKESHYLSPELQNILYLKTLTNDTLHKKNRGSKGKLQSIKEYIKRWR